MVILDASGSMRGRVDGRTKWEVAKETLAKVVGAMPPERDIGLMAYGHKGGKCNDIEVLTNPAKGTGAAIINQIGKLRPRGETPLSDSVRAAAKELKYQSKPATVVVITDGIESCNKDPCALGAELAGDGIDFTTHVIGFGLSEKEGGQVACLAHNTGGQYFAVNDASQLKAALDKSLEKPVDVATPAPETKKAEPPPPPPVVKAPVFAADFKNGIDLTKWEIVNENKNRYGILDGRWVVSGTRHGMLDNPKKENLLVAKADLPAGDFDAVADFTATMGEGTSHVSVGIFKDDRNFVEAVLLRDRTYNALKVAVRRMADGQVTEQIAGIAPIGPHHNVGEDGSATIKHIDTQGARLTMSKRGIKVHATIEFPGAPTNGVYKGPITTNELSIFGLEGKLVFKPGVWGCQFDFQPCGENIVRLDRVEMRTP